MEITPLQLRYLLAVRKVCNRNGLGITTPKEIFDEFCPPYDHSLGSRAPRMMLLRLLASDLLERPVRGGYRLSERGGEVVAEILGI